MTVYEWTQDVYVKLVAQIEKSEKIEPHPCKYKIISTKLISINENHEEGFKSAADVSR